MTDTSRRNLIAWSTPVVFTVLLPKHAAATDAPPTAPGPLNFSTESIGCSDTVASVVIKNNEPEAVTLNTFYGGNDYSLVAGTLPQTIPVGATFEFSVTPIDPSKEPCFLGDSGTFVSVSFSGTTPGSTDLRGASVPIGN